MNVSVVLFSRFFSIAVEVSGYISAYICDTPPVALPEFRELPAFVNGALPAELKVPVTERQFDTLVGGPGDLLSDERVGEVFRVSEEEYAEWLYTSWTNAMFQDPLIVMTEGSFISFWE